MAERTSYISLDRKITEWRWYKDPVCSRLFIHLLLTVYWDDGYAKGGVEIKRGQRLVNVGQLAEELNLTYKQTYNGMIKLVKTGELGKQNRGKNLLLTVLKYDRYQKRGKQRENNRENRGSDTYYIKNKPIKEEKKVSASGFRPEPPPPLEKEEANLTFEDWLERERNKG